MNINPLTQQPFSEGELAQVIKQGNQMIAIDAEIANLEAQLEIKKAVYNQLKMQLLPEAMAAIGLNNFQMSNGAAITIKPFYQCSISDKDPELKNKALTWLRKNGVGALIKQKVEIALGTDSVKEHDLLVAFLEKKKLPFTEAQAVHAATLKSFMKEQIEAGKPFPMDIFKGYAGKVAIVEIPKQK